MGFCEEYGEKFHSRQRLEIHQCNEHPETLPVGFVIPLFKCVYCRITFAREDSRNRHQKAYEGNQMDNDRKKKECVCSYFY